MADDVLRSFLVKLGFQIDGAGQQKFTEGVIQVTKAVAELAAGSIAAAAGVVAAIGRMASASDDLFFISQRTKSSASSIQAFGYAASQMGSSVEAARASLEGLANWERSNPGAKGLLQSLGVNPNASTTEQMTELGARFSKMPAYLSQRYAGLMGIDPQVLRAMEQGMGEFTKEYTDMQQKAGVNSEDATVKGHKFMLQLRELGVTFDILAQKAAVSLYKGIGDNVKRFQTLVVNNFQNITDAIVAAAKVILNFADVVIRIVTRAGQLYNDLAGWFNGLNSHTKALLETMAAVTAAWLALDEAMDANPFGMLALLILGIIALYDDWKTWKEGGKHLINWDYWDPEARKAIKVLKEIAAEIDKLVTLVGGPNGWQHIMEAFALYVGTKWAATLVGAFSRVGGAASSFGRSLAPINAALIAIDAWNKLQAMNNDQSPAGYAIGSPFWHGIPEEEQKLFPNSPYNQSRHPTPEGGWKRYTPNALAGRAWKYLFGKKTDVDPSIPAVGRAFLDTTASGESGGDYSRTYGDNPDITSYADHPRKEYAIDPSKPVGPGNQTSAAGKYQFESGTWDRIQKALKLPDFTPANQDKGAWWLAQQDYYSKTGRDLETDLKSGNKSTLAGILSALHPTWTSLNAGASKLKELSGNLAADNPHGAPPAITGQAKTLFATPLSHPGQIMPQVARPNYPAGPGSGAAANQNVSQTNTIHVSGSSDPHAAAKLMTTAQNRLNSDLVRNVQTRAV